MRLLTLGVVLAATSIALTVGQTADAKPLAIQQSFLMTVTEDGKAQPDWLELWEIHFDLSDSMSSAKLDAASIISDSETHVYVWTHRSHAFRRIGSIAVQLEMNGRLGSPFGMQLTIKLNPERTRIVDVQGTARSGPKGQSVVHFQVDRQNRTRKLAPLYNPSWSLETN